MLINVFTVITLIIGMNTYRQVRRNELFSEGIESELVLREFDLVPNTNY